MGRQMDRRIRLGPFHLILIIFEKRDLHYHFTINRTENLQALLLSFRFSLF